MSTAFTHTQYGHDRAAAAGTDEKKHVLVTAAWFPSKDNTNGIFVKEQAEALARRGHKVAALIIDHDNLRTLLERRGMKRPRYLKSELVRILRPRILFPFPYRFFDDPEAAYRRYIEAAAIRTIDAYIRAHGPIDLVHHHCLSDNSYVARALSNRLQVPYVFTEYSNYWIYDDLSRFNSFETPAEHVDFVQGAAARVAAAKMRAEGYRQIFGAEFRCIPNLVAKSFEAPLATRNSGGVFRFVCAAVLDRRKRQDLVLNAFASSFKGKPASLTFVGNGPYRADYEALAQALGIADQVEFAGIRSRDEVRAIFDTSHVGILSSQQETFGIVLAEAMFRGIPVISTRSGGPEEIIGPGRGLLVPVGDEKALADAMLQIQRDYDTYDPHAIRAWAVGKYSEDVIAAQIEQLYTEICGQ